MDVVVGEHEGDVSSGVCLARNVDADKRTGFHEHDPIFPE